MLATNGWWRELCLIVQTISPKHWFFIQILQYKWFRGALIFFTVSFLFKLCFSFFFPWRYPWEWRNPYLYPFSGMILLGLNLSAVITVACVICYYVANCYMFIAFVDDIKQEIDNLTEIHRSEGGLLQLKGKMAEIVRLHSNAKQLSLHSIWSIFFCIFNWPYKRLRLGKALAY